MLKIISFLSIIALSVVVRPALADTYISQMPGELINSCVTIINGCNNNNSSPFRQNGGNTVNVNPNNNRTRNLDPSNSTTRGRSVNPNQTPTSVRYRNNSTTSNTSNSESRSLIIVEPYIVPSNSGRAVISP